MSHKHMTPPGTFYCISCAKHIPLPQRHGRYGKFCVTCHNNHNNNKKESSK